MIYRWRYAAPAIVLLSLIVGPVGATENLLDQLGFERSLSVWELRRSVQRQSGLLSGSEVHHQTKPIRPVPQIRRIIDAALNPSDGSLTARRARYAAIIRREAHRHGVDPNLVHAVIRAESAYRPDAKSPVGACGLMQLMPATARRFGVRNIWEPEQNIQGGVAYLRFLLDRFGGELSLVIAAYNAGEGAVEKHGNRVPPYAETRTYIRRVMGYLG